MLQAQSYAWQALADAPRNGQTQDDSSIVKSSLGSAVNSSGQIDKTTNSSLARTWQLPQLGATLAPATFGFEALLNPATRQVTLRYTLPRRQPVRLVINDLQGRETGAVLEFTQDAGSHELTYTLPLTLAPNRLQFTLSTAHGHATLPVSL
ncbi:hypothetical protein [Hymenobacter terrenus]|uniref:hypothetical protein n=1 Tax=Hymenobacter terrenus TaxID=1629124 RepID=UPI0012E06CD3|nr:hypothetical protein [Hymenobacter terrenus]